MLLPRVQDNALQVVQHIKAAAATMHLSLCMMAALRNDELNKALLRKVRSGLETLNKRFDSETSIAVQNARPDADNANTSDAQQLAESTNVKLSDEAATLLETLSNEAASEQGNNAADLLLQEIHGYPQQDRNLRELAEITDKLLGVRQTIVPRLALRIFSRDSRWSQEEWREWIAEWTFDRDMMNKAIDI